MVIVPDRHNDGNLMKNLCIYVQVRYASFRVKIRLLGHDKIKELASISSFARHP
jgi:hypothetical protein